MDDERVARAYVHVPDADVDGPSALGDLPVLSGNEELEFYDSIDFLLWLEQRRA